MAQCPDKIQFKTSDMGNGVSQLNIPLLFNISQDSVIITTANPNQGIFSSFKILSKHCRCNEDFSTGTIVYSLQSTESDTKGSAILTSAETRRQRKSLFNSDLVGYSIHQY
jgi:hypothetical protein